jgi:long-subunit fatty acid transport protein
VTPRHGLTGYADCPNFRRNKMSRLASGRSTMRKFKTAAGVLAASVAAAGAAQAGGIDRSGQPIGILFEKGRVLEFSFGSISPSVSGTDVSVFGGGSTGNVGLDYTQIALSYKYDINEKLSFAAIIDQPFGADVRYATSSVALGGTFAEAQSVALTGLLRYKINESFSVHGGLRAQRASGDIGLRGAAYGPFSGYVVNLDSDWALGYVVGVAYEKPEIALRVALTYNSKITHEFATTESGSAALAGGTFTSVTEVNTPQSVNLDFQTGIAKDTLLFGQIRWVDWSDFRVDPAVFTTAAGGGLIDLEDSTTYSIGVGRRFTPNWSGSISFSYESEGDPLVSPLAPTNGRYGVTLAAVYTKDNLKVTTGINYTKLGDAQAETGTPDTARADFTDSDSVGVGVRIAYTF